VTIAAIKRVTAERLIKIVPFRQAFPKHTEEVLFAAASALAFLEVPKVDGGDSISLSALGDRRLHHLIERDGWRRRWRCRADAYHGGLVFLVYLL
jgi:hypothetical protein